MNDVSGFDFNPVFRFDNSSLHLLPTNNHCNDLFFYIKTTEGLTEVTITLNMPLQVL
jgi:hypothetical protein